MLPLLGSPNPSTDTIPTVGHIPQATGTEVFSTKHGNHINFVPECFPLGQVFLQYEYAIPWRHGQPSVLSIYSLSTTFTNVVRGTILTQVGIGVKPFVVYHKTFAEFFGVAEPGKETTTREIYFTRKQQK